MSLLYVLLLYFRPEEWDLSDFLPTLMATLMLFFIYTKVFCFKNEKGSI